MNSADEIVARVIQTRATTKLMADPANPLAIGDISPAEIRQLLQQAGQAPFHYPCHDSHTAAGSAADSSRQPIDSPAPWRFYPLAGQQVRRLLQLVPGWNQPLGKIPAMLAAADAMILVTWLPDPHSVGDTAGAEPNDHLEPVPEPVSTFEPSRRNMEHIAAAAAAIQNLLLAATAQGRRTYWSSGGAVLRSQVCFDTLKIPYAQLLLGAIFLFPDSDGNATAVPGKHRGRQGEVDQFTRWPELP